MTEITGDGAEETAGRGSTPSGKNTQENIDGSTKSFKLVLDGTLPAGWTKDKDGYWCDTDGDRLPKRCRKPFTFECGDKPKHFESNGATCEETDDGEWVVDIRGGPHFTFKKIKSGRNKLPVSGLIFQVTDITKKDLTGFLTTNMHIGMRHQAEKRRHARQSSEYLRRYLPKSYSRRLLASASRAGATGISRDLLRRKGCREEADSS